MSKSDVFIYIGPSLEPWIEGFLEAIKNPDLQILAESESGGVKKFESWKAKT